MKLWAYILGMIVYALDGLIFVLVQDWVSVGFHAFVLFMLWGGYGVTKEVLDFQAASATANTAHATS
ncbi:MAG: hypothetical protein ACE5F8_01425 [Woeseiaceae bacterium]